MENITQIKIMAGVVSNAVRLKRKTYISKKWNADNADYTDLRRFDPRKPVLNITKHQHNPRHQRSIKT